MNNNKFYLLVKKELTDNRKPLLLALTGILGTFILLGAFLGWTRALIEVEIVLYILLGTILLSIGASLAFSNMKTKEGRINTLMLPVPILQKFFIRWIAAIPLLLAVVIFGMLLGDWVRIIVLGLTDKFSQYKIGFELSDDYVNQKMKIFEYIITKLNNDFEPVFFIFITAVLSAITVQAVYFLGSILWPKLSFIKTWAVTQVLQIVLGIGIVFSVESHLFVGLFSSFSFTGFMIIYILFAVFFCVALYWLAYLRFKRSQVIYKLF